jgi:hypothetical protein
MRPSLWAAALAPLLLGSCADPYLYHGALAEARGRGVNERQYHLDVKACASGPGSEWCRIAADNGNLDRVFPYDMKPLPKGEVYVYDASQCVGTFDHGLCRGTSRPRLSLTPTCHGETIDGVCAGPVF